MHVKEQEVMIFKSDNGYYSIGLRKKDRNGNYFNGYMPCQFKNGVNVDNKTKIKLKDAFISFYLKEKETKVYMMILDFEEVKETMPIELQQKIEEEDNLPF